MIDTARIKQDTNLLALIGTDTTLRRVASTQRGEYAGPCPFCRAGEDRFRVQPERGLWWCRQCSPTEHWQDAIDYVMQRDSVSFSEACRVLGGQDISSNGHQPLRRTRYETTDAEGILLAVHKREDYPDGSKRVWWELPEGTLGLGGLRVSDFPLYGIRQLLAAPKGSRVIVVEGEPAQEALARRGILTVGTVTGASGTPSAATLEPLLEYEVVLWPDNDDEGRRHMARIADWLTDHGGYGGQHASH
jgi:DNA primase